jgi:hypothetical protein
MVRKRSIDEPPADTTVATVPISGNHAITTINVTVPRVPSLRPDHKHFFYAVVWAGTVRVWTSPIFTASSTQFAQAKHASAREKP